LAFGSNRCIYLLSHLQFSSSALANMLARASISLSLTFLIHSMVVEAGKSNFCQMVWDAQRHFGTLTGKVSATSDAYGDYEHLSLVVIYKIDGKLKFTYPVHSWGGRFFHVSISNTKSWPSHAFRRAGQGLVHDYHHKKFTGLEYTSNRVCAAGGAIRQGTIKHSSLWINTRAGHGCTTDGNGEMSGPEQAFLDAVVLNWKNTDNLLYSFSPSFVRQHCGRSEL